MQSRESDGYRASEAIFAWALGLGIQCGTQTLNPPTPNSQPHMSCSLNSLKGGYIGDYIEDYYRGY